MKAKHRDTPTIVEFLTDRQLLGLSISPAQETCLRGIYGLPISQAQLALWRECTGRQTYLGRPFGEATVIAGARAGKDSRIAAPVVCFEAVFGGHERHLARGERGVLVLVAQDLRATRVAFSYVKDYLMGSPLLAGMVAEVLNLEVTLTNGLTVACFPCTLRSLRGWSIPVGVMDELAFYRLEGQADSDAEIQASIRRGMVSFPAPRSLKITTPYMKSGIVFDDFRKAWGQDNGDLLVWRASSALMNPSLRVERLERERRLDPDRFAREYLAEFAEDLDALLPGAWVDAAVVPGRHELPPQEGVTYIKAVDPSGAGADAFPLTVIHAEGNGAERRVVQDVMKSWGGSRSAAVDLEGVVKEIAAIVKRYGGGSVIGDKYAAGWVRQAFERQGIRYEEAPDKSTAYLEVEPLFAQGRIELLDHPLLIRELKTLERRPRAGGRTVVDHPHGGHDDHANVLALAACQVSSHRACTVPGCDDAECSGAHMFALGGPGVWDTGAPVGMTREEYDRLAGGQPDPWEAAVEPTWAPPDADPELSAVVGLAVEPDRTGAAVLVTRDEVDDLVVLLRHQRVPLADLERTLSEWRGDFDVRALHATAAAEPHPWWFTAWAVARRAEGLVVEVVGDGWTAGACEHLRSQFSDRRIVVYAAVLNARGNTMTKALALAVAAARAVLVEEAVE